MEWLRAERERCKVQLEKMKKSFSEPRKLLTDSNFSIPYFSISTTLQCRQQARKPLLSWNSRTATKWANGGVLDWRFFFFLCCVWTSTQHWYHAKEVPGKLCQWKLFVMDFCSPFKIWGWNVVPRLCNASDVTAVIPNVFFFTWGKSRETQLCELLIKCLWLNVGSEVFCGRKPISHQSLFGLLD